MLVLDRKILQRILINIPPSTEARQIMIQVVKIQNMERVKVGIEADRDCSILRSELVEGEP